MIRLYRLENNRPDKTAVSLFGVFPFQFNIDRVSLFKLKTSRLAVARNQNNFAKSIFEFQFTCNVLSCQHDVVLF